MTPSRAIIITFVIRSTPFCRPKLHTKKPMTTTASIQPTISEGLASMVPKTPGDAVGVKAVEGARGHFRHVGEHPATDRGVEHHEQHATDVGPPGEPVPAPRGLQDVEGLGGRTLGGAADGELHDHDGRPKMTRKMRYIRMKAAPPYSPAM